MISTAYVRTMAAYNREMNGRLYAAAATLSDEARRAERGAFWGSVHGTLNHLLWADRMWMSRFAGWPKPEIPLKASASLVADFAALRTARSDTDRALCDWAGALDEAWLEGDLTWFSGAAGREFTLKRSLLVVHMFNHQTHHRGQVHALLTALGTAPGDTDLMLIVPAPL